MRGSIIPFEIHITVTGLSLTDEQRFIEFCIAQSAKPILIELWQGSFMQQPMFTKLLLGSSLDEVLINANAMMEKLERQGFEVNRLKIEVPAEHYGTFESATNYFEWHGKIPFKDIDKLLLLCDTYKVHLSKNALRNETETRFVTLREFGNKTNFNARTEMVQFALHQGGWNIIKQQSEYCIYDSNVLLDKDWLPK